MRSPHWSGVLAFALLATTPLACSTATSTDGKGGGKGSEDSKLQIEDIQVGTGKVAEAGDHVAVHYTGRLTDGTKFDSSLDRQEPFRFQLGRSQVIRGWDDGIEGMREGGKRKLTVPPELGYGASGRPPKIPPYATLVFDVELLKVE